MVKTSTHTPNYIGASGVWPLLGGSEHAGDGVVIGMIDTGIDPKNPSFVSSNMSSQAKSPPAGFKGICRAGNRFPADSCNGKIVGARWFARAAQESGEFNATIHYASPYDSDGHGRLAIYKLPILWWILSDVIAAVDRGWCGCYSLSMAPSSVSPGPASFLNLLEYYNNNTVRDEVGNVVSFGATARILEGRHATYTGEAPVVADYSSRGPDVENSQLQPAEVLKPNVMAPGHLIWGAWSPTSDAMPEIRGESYALLSGTSMAAPHVAGVAALIKQRHPTWSPAMVMSAIMTSADAADRSGRPLMARGSEGSLDPATPFDMGAGAVNAARAMDPGLVFDAGYRDYLRFLCSVPGVDDAAVLRAVGAPCPLPPARAGAGAAARWCSDLNSASVTVASLVGSRRVERRVTSVGAENETYVAYVRAPEGVAVRVWPAEFAIAPGATRTLRIVLNATAPGARSASARWCSGATGSTASGSHSPSTPPPS
ncbi:hypothetical protein HU200_042548 [Digitaria exilis]|uniref:Uncharacterized protein n=1 Tax=Digitaria exilis TaxID=1010633 RepID=A0A835B2B5_9POAL|nr:hypothetical protein HU200_042548 [Digitaria exilis]